MDDATHRGYCLKLVFHILSSVKGTCELKG